MGKFRALIACSVLLSGLAAPLASQVYDNSPGNDMVIPECIWAPASGGGTWVSEVHITAKVAGTLISLYFFTGTEWRYLSNVWMTTMANQNIKCPNMLSVMQNLDPSYTYYGKVGTLVLEAQDPAHPIWGQAMTVNGDYGKTFPALPWTDAWTANVGRDMVIPNIKQIPQYRTFVGFWNFISTGGSMTVRFTIMDQTGSQVAYFDKTFSEHEFKSFNPFTEAGLTGNYENNWLYIHPLTSASSAAGSNGLLCFGSIADNYTNDTCALIAMPYN